MLHRHRHTQNIEKDILSYTELWEFMKTTMLTSVAMRIQLAKLSTDVTFGDAKVFF